VSGGRTCRSLFRGDAIFGTAFDARVDNPGVRQAQYAVLGSCWLFVRRILRHHRSDPGHARVFTASGPSGVHAPAHRERRFRGIVNGRFAPS
jgi:hypothetical protein